MSPERKRLYIIFSGMKGRCYKPNYSSYVYYGAKGIKICDEWRDNFDSFVEWAMTHGYTNDLSIDRIDSNKDYCPDNCRWIPLSENSKWNGNAQAFTACGITDTGSGWAARLKMTGQQINRYYKRNGYEKTITHLIRLYCKQNGLDMHDFIVDDNIGKTINGWKIIADTGKIDAHENPFYLVECATCGFRQEKKLNQIKPIRSCSYHTAKKKIFPNETIKGIYTTMISQCYRPYHLQYEKIGGVGIRVCDEWKNNSAAFVEWVKTSGYQHGDKLSRKDESKDFSPGNCYWKPREEVVQPSQAVIFFSVDGIKDTATGWSNRLGVHLGYFYEYREKYGHEKTEELIHCKLANKRNDIHE